MRFTFMQFQWFRHSFEVPLILFDDDATTAVAGCVPFIVLSCVHNLFAVYMNIKQSHDAAMRKQTNLSQTIANAVY